MKRVKQKPEWVKPLKIDVCGLGGALVGSSMVIWGQKKNQSKKTPTNIQGKPIHYVEKSPMLQFKNIRFVKREYSK